MRDAPKKTRHAVQMALAARALIDASADDHRKRVLGRHVFTYLHDVVRFAPAWRNAIAGEASKRAAADAAAFPLERLRTDWERYQEVRHYLSAKRQLREAGRAPEEELEAFELWASIGALAIECLTDDAAELYSQLSAVTELEPIEYQPTCPADVERTLGALDPVGQEAFFEANATTFAAAKGGTVSVRMGGEVGRLVPLINDVAESAETLRALLGAVAGAEVFGTLVRCQLPSEVDELLTLTVGSPAGRADERPSLLGLYERTKGPSDTVKMLHHLAESIPGHTRDSLRDWRNRLGAHIDDGTPWIELAEGIRQLKISEVADLLDHVLLELEIVACAPGGPLPLLFPSRQIRSLQAKADELDAPLSYSDPDSETAMGEMRSALPPSYDDSPYVIWVGGPKGHLLNAAIAGMAAGRGARLKERLESD